MDRRSTVDVIGLLLFEQMKERRLTSPPLRKWRTRALLGEAIYRGSEPNTLLGGTTLIKLKLLISSVQMPRYLPIRNLRLPLALEFGSNVPTASCSI